MRTRLWMKWTSEQQPVRTTLPPPPPLTIRRVCLCLPHLPLSWNYIKLGAFPLIATLFTWCTLVTMMVVVVVVMAATVAAICIAFHWGMRNANSGRLRQCHHQVQWPNVHCPLAHPVSGVDLQVPLSSLSTDDLTDAKCYNPSHHDLAI